jgi:hypothetical protein
MSHRRSQSRSASLVEAGANVVVGYLVALASQQLVFPLFGIQTSLAQGSGIAAAFTAISLVRSYLLRRAFERIGSGRGSRSIEPLGTWRVLEER